MTAIDGRSRVALLPRRAAFDSAVPAPSPASILSGFRHTLATARVWAHIVWLAFRKTRNPFRAVAALRALRARFRGERASMPRKYPAVSGRLFPSLYLPGWPSPAFDQRIDQELGRVSAARAPALGTAIVAITRRCALRCEHCVEWDVLNRAEGMSVEELRLVVRLLRQRGVTQLFLSGGEPLQRFDPLLDLVASVGGEVDVWVLSSGRGLTRDRACRLAEAGLTGVALSLDHWDTAAHDAFRGRAGSFDAVTTAAAEVRRAGLVLTLSLCAVRSFVSQENLARYAELAHSLGASFIQLLEPRAVGHYAGQDVGLDPAQQQELERFAAWLNRAPEARKLPMASYLEAGARLNGCGGGDRYAYVDTEGALHACPFCRDHGVPLVSGDTQAAFRALHAAGCPSHASHCSTGIPS